MRKRWTDADNDQLVRRFSGEPTATIAQAIGRTVSATSQQAKRLGLKKTKEYLASAAAGRIQSGDLRGAPGRFAPGHVPANKGLRRPGWTRGRMAETQFRKGERRGVASRNWRPIGTILVDTDGYKRIKVREWKKGDRFGFGNPSIWPFLHRHLWTKANGPIPVGHAVVFVNGDKTDCRLANLQLITRRELMARNTVHNLPQPLVQAIQLLGALNRRIRKETKGA